MAGTKPHSGNLKSVYVARTLETSQRGFSAFLKTTAKRLGSRAVVRQVASTHVTFLESQGVKERLMAFGYGPHELAGFTQGMQSFLDKHNNGRANIRVETDPHEPLIWINRRRGIGKLAVKLTPGPTLVESRDRIEAFAVNQLGPLPQLRPFKPHITIGTVELTSLSPEAREDPSSLLAAYDLAVPHWAALNGLEVFLGHIHPQPRPTQPPTAAEEIRRWLEEINEPDQVAL